MDILSSHNFRVYCRINHCDTDFMVSAAPDADCGYLPNHSGWYTNQNKPGATPTAP
jgi:hypothetical protein